MKPSRLSALLMALSVSAAPSLASGINAIPETPGWQGFVILGVGYTSLESNEIAGNSLIDIGVDTITSVNDAAQSDDAWHAVVTGEVNYTFRNQWQVFFGTSLEDAVTLEPAAQLGVRKGIGSNGILQGGLLFSGLPSDVWADPYAEGVRREATNRDASGLRLSWDRILGSALQVTFSYRGIDIETERSGQGVTSVTCDTACQDLLRRDGDQYFGELSYLFKLGGGQRHLLRPMVRYTIDNRDGDAISGDSYRLQLSYVYLGQGYSVASNVAVGGRSYDEPNPIYGIGMDSRRLVVDATLFYRLPFASGRWQVVGSVLWGEQDSDVNFHDSELFNVSVGAMYRFGGPSGAQSQGNAPESEPVL